MTRLGMTINLDRCTDTRGCLGSCKQENYVPIGAFWCRVFTSTSGDFPNTETYFIPIICQHCANPKCVSACPEVFSKREDGIVVFDRDTEKCATCPDHHCLEACPYGAIAFHEDARRVGKCDMCAHLIDEGGIPACVRSCNSCSWTFGDFDDPESPVSQVVAKAGEFGCHKLKPEAGTDPTMVYILHGKQWKDMEGLRRF